MLTLLSHFLLPFRHSDNVVPYSLTKADGLTKINVMLDDETDGDLTPYLPGDEKNCTKMHQKNT